ncbi:dynein regulatory complex protein 1 [Nasonia vitripennis]|uniref:Dynein regulatory complex protein 1 n=1 Tax=Nasonia vitripennis TaxID=7425 RepID=A0A7M7PZB5_NASVI|nr:dynein regulatory complex protein 1 [Nasonia vitripennis]XP_031779361.1 dynein regulatory complex protein 1 [Nasonia vitripennis]
MAAKPENLDKDFTEIEEPSVLSTDPNERKLARRLRIQRRVEALQKLEAETTADAGDHSVEECLTEKRIVASAELLEKLIAEGNEVISNVRVANDAREIERRREASKIREKLLKRLEESADECKKRYDLINERWPLILESNDPLDINSEMESQKEKCDEVLAKKDKVIAELKEELRKADDKYSDDQRKQKDDIKLLIERIENQMSTMENVYGRELELIEKTLKTERESLVNSFQKKWDNLYKQQEDEDVAGDKKRNEIMKEYEEEMERVMTEHDEEFRAQKIQLENECQDLQQQVEKMKALCLLNSEKLTYNYTVLKSREEENTIVKNQQKRKINKLQGLINNLKKNYSELEENTKLEIDKLSGQIVKAHTSITELEEKSIHFTRVNEKQYLDIWDMKSKNANELVKKILTADKIIHERTLGILWDSPQTNLPKKEDLPSYCAAMDLIKKRKQEEAQRLNIFQYEKKEKSALETKLEREVLSNILKQISQCSGYLIEDKLQEMISSRNEEEKTIIRLDNVFQALSISTPEEISMLLDFFLPYSYCPVCSAKEDSISSDSFNSSFSSKSSSCAEICDGCNDENVKKLVDAVKEEVGVFPDRNVESRIERFSSNDTVASESLSDEVNESEFDDEKATKGYQKYTCDKGHVLEIQAAHVSKAMREIVTKCSVIEEKEMISFEERLNEKKYTISRNLAAEDVQNYWSNYRKIFGTQKQKLWDAILVGLSKYYEVLRERHSLCTEIDDLKLQNSELERLLASHTASPEDGISLLQVKSAKHSSYI